MHRVKTACLLALSTLALAACGQNGGDGARDSIRAVGSSTVFPFAKAVSESFRSEEHTSELQSLMRISYAVFCLKKKKNKTKSKTLYTPTHQTTSKLKPYIS